MTAPIIPYRAIPRLDWSRQEDAFLPVPFMVNWHGQFRFQNPDGELSIKVNPAKRVDETELLILELTARGRTPLENMDDWFSHAHEWIVRGFEDLTSDEAQKELWRKHVQ